MHPLSVLGGEPASGLEKRVSDRARLRVELAPPGAFTPRGQSCPARWVGSPCPRPTRRALAMRPETADGAGGPAREVQEQGLQNVKTILSLESVFWNEIPS